MCMRVIVLVILTNSPRGRINNLKLEMVMDIKIDSESMSGICDALIRLCAERDALRAELQQLREQEPEFYYWRASGEGSTLYRGNYFGDDRFAPLYAAPVPAMPTEIPAPEGWKITLNQKPIPSRDHDYDFVHEDYDGADGGNGLCGTAKSVSDALDQIIAIEINRELDAMPIPKQEPDKNGLLPLSPHDHPDCQVMIWSNSEIDAIKDYASRCIKASQAAAMPEGWKLVPVHPTREMMDAMREKVIGAEDYVMSYFNAYHAALSAAPKPDDNPA